MTAARSTTRPGLAGAFLFQRVPNVGPLADCTVHIAGCRYHSAFAHAPGTLVATIAYRYGLGEPIDWDSDVADQLYLQTKFWNRLVEIEREAREQYRAVVGADDTIGPLTTEIEAAKQKKERLFTERKALRAKARKKIPTPDHDARIKALAEQIRALAAVIKTARIDAKERLAPHADAINTWRFDAVKQARNASGLWWGNYNAVAASYDAARAKAMKEGTELQFHRFTGEGRLTCQIQGGASAEAIMTGKCTLVNVAPLAAGAFSHPSRGERRRLQRTQIAVTAFTRGTERRMLTLPMQMHRPLPDGAIVKQVTLTRRKVGTRFRWHAVFTCSIPDTEMQPHPSERACGVNLGFRQVKEGLRVATVAWDSRKTAEHLILPAEWLAAMDRVETLQSRRDEHLLPMHAAAKLLPRDDDTPEALRERLDRIARAPKIGSAQLAAMVLAWRDGHPGWQPEQLPAFEAWRRNDKRAAEEQANLRDKLAAQRKEHYRLWAHDLVRRFSVIAVGKIELRKLAELQRADGTENDLHARARANRTRASLFLLQQELAQQAMKQGSRIVMVDGPVSSTCHACGASTTVTLDIMQVCEHCHAVWDQDANAALNAHFDGVQAPPPSERTGDAQAAA